MIASRFLTASFALLSAGAVTLAASSAMACVTDAECGHGFECTEYSAPCASPDAPACPPGESCFAPPPTTCTPTVITECTLKQDCASDADCADGMVCFTSTSQECSGSGTAGSDGTEPAPDPSLPPPPPGEEPIAPPPECTTSTVTQCVPRYYLPCTTAADCGAGFECVATESCWCSGSSGGAAEPSGTGGMASGEVPLLPPPEDCGCTPGPNRCEPVEQPCTMNAECPTGWLCKEVGGYDMCSGGAPAFDPASGGTATMPPPPPECTSVPGELLCVPPEYDGVGVPGGVLGRDESGSTSGQGGTFNGGTGSGTGAAAPPAAPNPADVEEDGASSGDASSGDDGSCQMGSGHAGSSGAGASVLALMGLAGLLRRRRAA